MSKSFIIDTGLKVVLNLKKVSPENKKIFLDDKKSKETNVKFSEHELSILKKLDQNNIENSNAKQNDSEKIKTLKSTIELGRLKYAYDLVNKSSKQTKNQIYLNDILIDIVLPINEIRERNPILEKRCEQLRIDQERREYKSMTKNVDTTRKFMPEDTIAFQSMENNISQLKIYNIDYIFTFSEANQQTTNCSSTIHIFCALRISIWIPWS